MAVKTVQTIINGVTTTLTYNSTSKRYEATITAPSTSSYNNNDGHYYPVTVKATDEAGNTTTKNDTDATLGASLKLQVKEKVAPIITITYPTASALITNNKPNSGSAEAVTVGADGSFSKSLTLASGNNTITIVATDSAGKSSTVTRTVTLDTTAPTIKSVTLTPNPVDAGKTYVISVEVTD